MDFVIVNHKRGKETKHERNFIFHLHVLHSSESGGGSSFIIPAKAQFYADRAPRGDCDHRHTTTLKTAFFSAVFCRFCIFTF